MSQIDITAPVLGSVSFDVSDVNVSTSSQIVTVSARFTDDLSGFDYGSVGFTSPSGEYTVSAYFYDYYLVSGTDLDGVYERDLEIPAYAESGIWELSYISIGDKTGNTSYITGEALADTGLTASITVNSAASDITAPVFESVSFDVGEVNVSSSSQTITVSARFTDDLSGFDYGSVGFTSPSGEYTVSAYFYDYYLVSGTDLDGVYERDLEIPAYAESGIWELSYINIGDKTGNTSYITGEALADTGLTASITVNSAASDITAPVLGSVSFDVSDVNVSTSSQIVTVSARITDDLSGFDYGWLYFTSPSGEYDVVAHFSEYSLVSGVNLDGIYEYELEIPAYAESGIWELSRIELNDQVRNTSYITGEALADTGLTASITVNPDLPIIVSSLPSDNAGSVSLGTDISMTFSEPIKFGAGTIALRLGSEAGSVIESFDVATSSRLGISGDTLTINPTSDLQENATYFVTIESGAIVDFDGNSYTQTTDYSFRTSDGIAPELESLSISSEAIDTSDSSVEVTITAHITDDLSGFESLSMSFRSPSGSQSVYASLSSWNLESGTLQDGVYETTVVFPQYSEAGEWTYEYGYLRDSLGNYVQLSTADLKDSGLPDTISVTSSQSDSTAPVLADLSVNTSALNTDYSSQSVVLSGHITDDLSGFESLSMSFRSPSGSQSVYASLSSWNLESGTLQDGVYETTVVFPQYSEAGEWTYEYGYLRDSLGNDVQLSTADLKDAGLPETFTISSLIPTVKLVEPDYHSLNVACGSDIILTFSENVRIGAGYVELHRDSPEGVLVSRHACKVA